MLVLHFMILAGLYCACAATVLNLATFGWLRSARPSPEGRLVSILIPARNEARNIEACVRSLQEQDYPYCEVIVLDDQSEDETFRLLQGMGMSETGSISRIIRGRQLPAGWAGKCWACHQLAQAARGEYLFFTDADTRHAQGTVSALVAYAETHRTDLLSAWPRLVTETVGEKLVVPLLLPLAMTMYPHWLLTLLQRFPQLASKIPQGWMRCLGAANGQSLFFRRAAYYQIGGHEAVRGHLVEDVALGRAVAAQAGAGLRLVNCSAIHFSTCRMYRNFGEVWEGFTKNVRACFEDSLASFLTAGFIQFLCFLLPWLLALDRLTPAVMKELCIGLIIRALVTARFRTSWVGVVLHPVGQTLAILIGLNSWRQLARGAVMWKGRRYSESQGIASGITNQVGQLRNRE